MPGHIDKINILDDLIDIFKFAEAPLTIAEIKEKLRFVNSKVDIQGDRIFRLNLETQLDLLIATKKIYKFIVKTKGFKTTQYRKL